MVLADVVLISIGDDDSDGDGDGDGDGNCDGFVVESSVFVVSAILPKKKTKKNPPILIDLVESVACTVSSCNFLLVMGCQSSIEYDTETPLNHFQIHIVVGKGS